MRSLAGGEQLLDLGERRLGALARDGAALDEHPGRAGEHEGRVATGGDRDHERATGRRERRVALSTATRSRPRWATALTPSSGCEEWAARPGEGDLDEGVAAQALGDGQPGRLADDGDVRVHPRPGRASSTASVPRLASSSSATRASTTRPGDGPPTSSSAATTIAATPPFMSLEPRPGEAVPRRPRR